MRFVSPFVFIGMLLLLLTIPAVAQWSLAYNPVGNYVRIQAFASIDAMMFAGTRNGGVYTNSTYANSDWTQINEGLTDTSVSTLTLSGTTLYAGTAHGVFVSTDSGAHWSAQNNGLSTVNIAATMAAGSTVFAGTWGGGMYLSTDQGAAWTAPNTPPAEAFVIAFAKSDSFLFASATNYSVGKVYRSSDGGMNWTEASAGLPSTYAVLDLRAAGRSVVASVYQSGNEVVYSSQSFHRRAGHALQSIR
jgi:ligand-binding sensor domain-containing protein